MSEWKDHKLGEVISLGNGKERPKEKGAIPVYGGNGILDYTSQHNYEGESIIIGRVGAYCGSVFYSNTPIWVSDNALVAKPKEGHDTKFLYYYLKHIKLNGYAEGSSHPLITQTLLNSIDITIPNNKSEQQRIALVLTSLDDKIDLLHRENATLESIAEILFKQSFIKQAKEDWIDGKLGDLIVIKYGKDHKKLQEGNIPVIGSGGIMRYVDKYLHDKESVLIPRKGSLNNVMYINEPFWTVDTMFYTEMRRPNIAKYIYHVIKGLDLANMNVGSAVPSMTTEVLNNIPINIPPQIVFDKFEDSVLPLYTKIRENKKQISTLIRTRDELLPRLINKEIRI